MTLIFVAMVRRGGSSAPTVFGQRRWLQTSSGRNCDCGDFATSETTEDRPGVSYGLYRR